MWVINEKEIFGINQNLEIQIKKIGENNLVIIDNFYQNPDAVRNLLDKSPATTWKKLVHNYPDARHNIMIDLSNIKEVICKITEKIYQVTIFDDLPLMTNLFKEQGFPVGSASAPHFDPNYFAAIIYLNKPEECHGGTAFYLNKKTGKEYSTNSAKDFPVLNKSDFISESNEDWELLDYVEMKYNRFVLYRGNIFHAAQIKKEWFKDFYRIVQVFFFSKVLPHNSVFAIPKMIKFEIKENQPEVNIQFASGLVLPVTQSFGKFLNMINGKQSFGEIIQDFPGYFNINDHSYFSFHENLFDFIQRGVLKLVIKPNL